jgi:alkylhydroperoxidase/carboxymuconolactone decarboxylase family protein YurZ
MSDKHLPDVYLKFRSVYPGVSAALDGVAEAVADAGPLDERTARLVKLGLAIGSTAEGAVRSHTRRAMAAGATPEEVRQVALLAMTTCGFPTAIAGLGWVDEVLASERVEHGEGPEAGSGVQAESRPQPRERGGEPL